MASIFSKIIAGEIPCYKIAENENCFAFLDINPLNEGHTLVVPKTEIDYLFDIDDPLYNELFLFSKKIATAIKNTFKCERIGMAVLGFDVNHAHIHLVPMNKVSDLDFSKEKLKLTQEQFQRIAEQIKINL
ncbi:HIT family protein [Bacteroidales bacterium OttesenSCG-928-K03]|nr:HIT family protein [Odoribacter sp. OttesenSCG-928-L07]MDL2239017.1 HIT family protein [Bacteroidales bacterium OttesenSCG-928-L14]MDL2242145.1 HIT family protein [Bacteroidales bacterium OttesenSCG-928-K03]